MSKSNPVPDDRFLLIWNESPKREKYYAIPRWEVERYAADLNAAHGNMVGGGENDEAANQIGLLIASGFKGRPLIPAHRTGSEGIPEGAWAKYKLYVDELTSHEFVGVYVSGIIL